MVAEEEKNTTGCVSRLRTRPFFFSFFCDHLPKKTFKQLRFGVGYLQNFNFNIEVEDGHLKEKK